MTQDSERRPGDIHAEAAPSSLGSPGKRSMTEARYGGASRPDAPSVPQGLPFMDVMLRSEAAPVQMQPAPGAAPQPGPRASVASLKVTAYLANGAVKQESLRDRWDGTPLPLVWKANRVGDAWQWSDGRAAQLRIFTGTAKETLVGEWASAQGAHKVVVHITDRVVDLDPLDVADVRGTERAKYSEQSWKLGDTLPDELGGTDGGEPITPSTPLGGESSFGTRPMFRPPREPGENDGNASAPGKQEGIDGGTGVDATVTERHGPRRGGSETGAASGSPSSHGRSPDARDEGDSQGDRVGPHRNDTAAIGRHEGPDGGRLGADVRNKDGSSRGRPDGEGKDTSIVHNPLAEKAPGAGGNIPDDGGERDGMPRGKAGKGDGGLPDGGLWKKLLTVPRDIAPAIVAGQILIEADITGVTGKVVQHALVKGVTAAALRKAARKEIAEYVELEIAKIEQNWSRLAGWEQMTEAERVVALQQAREAVAQRAYREVIAGLDNRIAELEGAAQSLAPIAGQEGIADDLVKQAVEHTEIELDALRKARRALDDFEMPRPGKDGPYHPRRAREGMEAEYPGEVDSATVPRPGAKNVKLAGQRHPVTGIPFDERGFPIFDDVAAFDTRLPSGAYTVADSDLHMEEATRQLRQALERGQVSEARFSAAQLAVIKREPPPTKIPGYTWHHHQELGRMQLVPSDIHAKTGHTGGMHGWFE